MIRSLSRAPMLGLFLALCASTALAQTSTVPFDMSGERGPDTEKTPTAEGGKTVTTPDATVPDTKVPDAKAQDTKVAETKVATPDTFLRRYIIADPSLMLEGEVANRSFPVFLTPQQAEAATTINLGYSNAVVVAPESSKLTITINDVLVGEVPVQSPEGTKDIRFDLPTGLLRPGTNRVTFSATQRHRTDCTIRSTYDLWTALDPARTFLAMPQDTSGRLLTTDDISAIGLGPNGQTKFILVAPELSQPIATNALMRLSQALALMAKMPNQTFDIVDTLPAASVPGQLQVLVGTAGDLAPLLPTLPETARSSAVATFVDAPAGGGKVLVVSGPDWTSIEGAVEGMLAPIDRPVGVTREALSVPQRNAAIMPLLTDATSLTLASLGVRTGEFSGRRFRTGFDVGIPADFYADAYGEATLLLDAAYSAEVQPGSHVDVYINGNIASTVPITNRNGGIFRHLPIRVTMRHLRPGPNRIDIEAVLMTETDKVCAPGASALEEPRFALFDSSEFRMPRFARVAQLPNLSALAGTGFPYSRQLGPTALYLDRLDTNTLSASATFLGKMAVASGRALQVRPESSALAIGERDAILVGSISQVPPLILSQTHIAAESASTWGGVGDGGTGQAATRDSFDAWQSRVREGSWRGQISGFETWLQETFDISLSSLRLLPGEEAPIIPEESARFLIAQGDSPERTATWTVLTAPSGAELKDGMAAVAQDDGWQQVAGYVSLESKDVETLDTRPVNRTRFVATQPWSFANTRLIAANWLSSNILAYAAVFVGLAVLLGIATSTLLRKFGRGA